MESLKKNKLKVRLFNKLTGLAEWMASLPNRLTPSPFRLVQIGSAFWQSRALYVAARLGLADELGDAGKSTQELARDLSLHEDHLYRLMRMLASIGIFEETVPRVFKNSKMSDHLRRVHPHSVRTMILMHNDPVMTKPWMESLEECIRSGETPFEKSHGVELFDYMNRDQAFDWLFSQAMDEVEALTGNAYLEDFDWSGFKRIIDVGGSKGGKSLAILAKNPHLKALVFDRSQVIEDARAYWQGKVEPSVLDRIEFADGDMFEAVPTAESDSDLYLFMAVFHSLGDEAAAQIFDNLKRAMGDRRSTALIVDSVAADMAIDPAIASFDMQMLIGTQGRERTREEWVTLIEKAGFTLQEVVDVRTFAKFIVVQPR